MVFIDSNGRLFGRWNIFDALTVGSIGLITAGVLLVQSGWHVTSGQVVEGESDIKIIIQIPNLKTLDRDMFIPGEKTAITIRNQPRGDVLIDAVDAQPVKVTLMGSGNTALTVEDKSQANGYDYIIQLKDHAKVTADGYVTEGVKVKVGLPIELEGFKYRVYGKIVDVQAVKS